MHALLVALSMFAQGNPPAIDPKHQAELDRDVEIGKKAAAEADKDKDLKPSTNKEYIDRVNRIGGEIAKIARVTQVEVSWGDKRLNPFDYTFKVVKNEDINAFSLPGGRIYVFEGLVKYVESDDELAGVLAHEISHAAFRHINSLEHEQNKIDLLTIPLVLISLLKGGQNAPAGMLMGQMLNTALSNGWSLKAETAADYGGFQYLLHTKYNPTAMLTVMERLARDERTSPGQNMGIFRTHPPSKERALAMLSQMEKRHIPVQRSAVTTSMRTTAVDKSLLFGKLKLVTLGGPDAESRAEALVPTLNDVFDQVPAMYEFSRAGNRILFRNRTIMQLTDDDAKAAGETLDKLGDQTMQKFHAAAFSLNFGILETG